MKKVLPLIVIITVLAAFFASKSPDGLDKTSELLGFAHKGIERSSLMTGYSMPFIHTEALSTAFAGIIGVMLILGAFLLVSKTWKSINRLPK